MKSLISIALIVLSVSAKAAQITETPEYYQIKSVKVTEVTELLPSDYSTFQMSDECSSAAPLAAPVELNPFDQVNVWIDQVVNLGQKVWNLVEQGRPVVSMKLASANALPKGLTCWTQLTGWSVPQTKVYRVTYENLYGMTVVDFAFRVGFVAGGSYQGKGKYVTQAQITPAQINVLWGFNLDATAEAPLVFNQGTAENPIGGVQLVVKWKVDTALQYKEQNEVFFVNGEGLLTHLE